jgi:hypothetical protein
MVDRTIYGRVVSELRPDERTSCSKCGRGLDGEIVIELSRMLPDGEERWVAVFCSWVCELEWRGVVVDEDARRILG